MSLIGMTFVIQPPNGDLSVTLSCESVRFWRIFLRGMRFLQGGVNCRTVTARSCGGIKSNIAAK